MGLTLSRIMRFRMMGILSKSRTILMVGLKGAGKSTILKKLNLGDVISLDANVEAVTYNDVSIIVWDLHSDGQEKLFQWKRFFHNIRGLIFVVDSSDQGQIQVADAKLKKLLDQAELRDAALLVFANKQEAPNAMSVSDLTDKLHLNELQSRPWYLQGCCAINDQGLYEGLDWLSSNIASKA